MKVAGLFAGIGGLELGLKQAGHDPELLCEIWPPASEVLKARSPNVQMHADVRELEALPSSIELIAAGFPCQDLSQAGRTAGIDGQRSGLVEHVFRLVDTCDAPLVLLENVPFMLRLDRGGAMSYLTELFEARGFRWAYRTINSLAFLPQRRERVFLLASRGELNPAEVLFSDEAFPEQVLDKTLTAQAHGFYWTEGVRGLGWASNAIPPLKNGSTIGIPSPPAILLPGGEIIKPDIRDAERLQGFDVDWTEPATRVGKASLRWSLVGNAVSVPVAKWIGERLLVPQKHRSERDTELFNGQAWPAAAHFDGAKRHRTQISDFPVWLERSPLHQFLRFPGELLSARATRGFYNRTTVAKLRFPPGFLGRVKAHLSRMEAIDQKLAVRAA
jgi:DNA (cytosine-5)-methyltransferase 1